VSGDWACVCHAGFEEVCVGAEVPLKLEHFAFSATGRAAFEARLKEVGQEYRSKSIEDIGIIQVNVWDLMGTTSTLILPPTNRRYPHSA